MKEERIVDGREEVEQDNVNVENSLNREFSKEELDRALKSVKHKSAPDIDGVEYRMLTELPG